MVEKYNVRKGNVYNIYMYILAYGLIISIKSEIFQTNNFECSHISYWARIL